jgi:hypothetical protein
MSSGRGCAAIAVLLALLTGCGPKKPTAVVSPPAAEAPALPPSQMAASLPLIPPAIPATTTHPVKLDTTAPPEVKPEVATAQPHHTPKHHPKSAAEEAKTPAGTATTPAPPANQVATVQPSDKTPLGQLSTPDDPVSRQTISEQIDATENGLNAIKRPLNSDEQKTVTLIRQYITRARDSLNVDDFAGANTLSSKAKQLLQELTKP